MPGGFERDSDLGVQLHAGDAIEANREQRDGECLGLVPGLGGMSTAGEDSVGGTSGRAASVRWCHLWAARELSRPM